MARVLSTAVPVLLLCCWCQLGCTSAVDPVASSVTVAVYVRDKHLPRRRRETTECEDVVDEKKATTIKGQSQNVNVSNMQECKQHCIRTITCRAAVYAKGKCAHGVSDESSTVTGNDSSNTTYFKVAYRCPRHFRCSQSPCKNGATCKPVSEGRGVECVCTAGWKSWFCEEKADDTGDGGSGAGDSGAGDTGTEDTGMSDTNKTWMAAAIVAAVVVAGVAATIAVVKATGTTAASTAGTAAAWYGGGFNIADFASKLGGTAIIKGGTVALAKKRDDDDDEDRFKEHVEDAADSPSSAAGSFSSCLTGGGND